MGTVRNFESEDEVVVVWDTGTAANYRCSGVPGTLDVRMVDTGPAGVRHVGVTCQSCRQQPIFGIRLVTIFRYFFVAFVCRWKCSDCSSTDYSLCSVCYHGDKHNLRHRFSRLTLPGGSDDGVVLDQRRKSKKIQTRGLCPGARVTRGVDWQWDDQDGGRGRKGKLTSSEDWSASSPRSAAYIVWDAGVRNMYRVGYDGMMDLKMVSEGKGGSVYRDHLPVLGQVSSHPPQLEVGDQVIVTGDLNTIQDLQLGHGGWTDGMMESLSQVGTVTEIDEDNDVAVCYPSGNKWTFNQACLLRQTVTPAPIHFSVGDQVQICDNITRLRELQAGHGEWVDSMAGTVGRLGRVHQVYADGDLKVGLDNTTWTYNPLAVTRVSGPGRDQGVTTIIRKLFETQLSGDPVEELVKMSAAGDRDRVRGLMLRLDHQVNGVFAGHTALQAACQNGHDDIVTALLEVGADIELEDDDGDRGVHHAAFGDAAGVMQLMGAAGADLNARNKRRQTPLHISVNKGHIDVVSVLLEHSCHTSLQDSEGDTPLHDAISKKRDDMISILLDHGADVRLANNSGFNSLHHASLRGNSSSLRLMLSQGTSRRPWLVDQGKEDGYTALHLACLNNHPEVVRILVEEAGANPDLQNVNLQTALHLAVERRHEDIVRCLVERGGAEVNLGDRDRDTPLHECLRHLTLAQLQHVGDTWTETRVVSTNIAACLVRHGASLDIKNKKGQTPTDLCPDSHLVSTLKSLSTFTSSDSSKNMTNVEECVICSDNKANVQFLPCRHVVTCDTCADIVKKCVKCRQTITDKVNVQFNDNKSLQKQVNAATNDDVEKLQQQLDDMKEQSLCPVCLDRSKNMIFLCGHGSCQMCGDRLHECPICRKVVEKRILLY